MSPRGLRFWGTFLLLAGVFGLFGPYGVLVFLVGCAVFCVVQSRRAARFSLWLREHPEQVVPTALLGNPRRLSSRDIAAWHASFDAARDGSVMVIDDHGTQVTRAPNGVLFEHDAKGRVSMVGPTGTLTVRGPVTPGQADRLREYWTNGPGARRLNEAGVPAASPLTSPAAPAAPAVDAALRDPMWSETIAQMCADRTELVSRVRMCQARVDAWQAAPRTGWEHAPGALDEQAEFDAAQIALHEARKELHVLAAACDETRAVRPGGDLDAWARVPASALVRLPRGTHAGCDCRFGHYDFHAIVAVRDGFPVRECALCAPATRWIETGVPA